MFTKNNRKRLVPSVLPEEIGRHGQKTYLLLDKLLHYLLLFDY